MFFGTKHGVILLFWRYALHCTSYCLQSSVYLYINLSIYIVKIWLPQSVQTDIFTIRRWQAGYSLYCSEVRCCTAVQWNRVLWSEVSLIQLNFLTLSIQYYNYNTVQHSDSITTIPMLQSVIPSLLVHCFHQWFHHYYVTTFISDSIKIQLTDLNQGALNTLYIFVQLSWAELSWVVSRPIWTVLGPNIKLFFSFYHNCLHWSF